MSVNPINSIVNGLWQGIEAIDQAVIWGSRNVAVFVTDTVAPAVSSGYTNYAVPAAKATVAFLQTDFGRKIAVGGVFAAGSTALLFSASKHNGYGKTIAMVASLVLAGISGAFFYQASQL